MKNKKKLGRFRDEWKDFLIQKGHYLSRSNQKYGIIESINGSGKRYIWLLTESIDSIKSFNEAELEYIREYDEQGKKNDKQVFVVIKFNSPISKVIIIPANRVIKSSIVDSSKGGIAWV